MRIAEEKLLKKSITMASKYLYSLGYDCGKIENGKARYCGSMNGNDITLVFNGKSKVSKIIYENEKTHLTNWL